MPNSNEKLSVLGYGCMRLPAVKGRQASMFSSIDKERAARQIRFAIDQGVNYLDTAYVYHAGTSESFLGEYVLKDGYREKVNIATKLPCMTINRKESIEDIFNKQLKKLQVEYIDYYLLHGLSGSIWDKMLSLDIINFMDNIRKQGKVRHMGFSFHGSKEDFKKIINSYSWEFTMVQYNILDEQAQASIDGIKYAHSKGLGVIVMEPLRGGTLARKIPGEAQKIYDSAPVKRTPAEWALRWVWNHPEITMLLSGMNDEYHINENIKIASESYPDSLSEEDLSILKNIKSAYLSAMKVGCTGCGYCMPCPAGINIPSAFLNLNNYHMFSKNEARLFHMLNAGVQTKDGKPHWTKSCLHCRECEKICPQGIKICDSFSLVQKHLEGTGVKVLSKIFRSFVNRNSKKHK